LLLRKRSNEDWAQNKTKYMAINTSRLLDPLVLEIGPYTFEHVHTYLGTKINK
jgi:hypothetical protein